MPAPREPRRRARFSARDLLRYGAVVFAAMALAYAARAWEAASNDVTVIYRGAPPGALVVELRDEGGDRLRRSEFAAGAERRHVVQLPSGRFEARMIVDDRRAMRRFVVDGDAAIEIAWDHRR